MLLPFSLLVSYPPSAGLNCSSAACRLRPEPLGRGCGLSPSPRKRLTRHRVAAAGPALRCPTPSAPGLLTAEQSGDHRYQPARWPWGSPGGSHPGGRRCWAGRAAGDGDAAVGLARLEVVDLHLTAGPDHRPEAKSWCCPNLRPPEGVSNPHRAGASPRDRGGSSASVGSGTVICWDAGRVVQSVTREEGARWPTN
jgi:hypothetical protein